MPIIPFKNFSAQLMENKSDLLKAVEKVLDSGQYILGSEVLSFEKEFAAYCGTKYAIGVSNGTSALYLALLALGIGPGDEVITAPNSFVASASAIALLGAKPVFADVGNDLNMDPNKLEKAITPHTRAIMPVHLTGKVAPMTAILEIAKSHDLFVVEDAAQAVGAKLNGQRTGSFGNIGCFSLHPLKNLHAYGDAGMITTNDPKLNEYLRKARNLGLRNREECEFWSFNCRLDELHAAMLRVDFKKLDYWTEKRREIAFRFNELLKSYVEVPVENRGEFCVFQNYMIQASRRDELLNFLNEKGVDAKIHYRNAIHLQGAARSLGYKLGDFPNAERVCDRIISLPIWPGMTHQQQDQIAQLIGEFYERKI